MKHYIQTQHAGLLHKSVAKPNVLGCHTQRVKFFTDELFKFLYTNYKSLYCITLNHCLWLKKCIVTCTKSRTPNILREFMFRRIAIYMTTFGYSIPGRTKSKERRDSIGINLYYSFDNFPLKSLFLYEWNCWHPKSFYVFLLMQKARVRLALSDFDIKRTYLCPLILCVSNFSDSRV